MTSLSLRVFSATQPEVLVSRISTRALPGGGSTLRQLEEEINARKW